ncbi:MAG: TolC family protein [Chthonomonadales bacterium]
MLGNPLVVAFLHFCAPIWMPPQARLTVEDAVRIALVQSPKLKAARMELEAQQSQADRERPVARPTVSARAEGTLQGPRVTFPRAGSGDVTVLPERYGQVALSVEQPLFRAGIRAAGMRFAAQTQANLLELRRQENDLALEVRKAFYAVQTAEAMSDTARSGADLARKHLELTRVMLQAGTASERDVKASEADVAQAEQGVYEAEAGVLLARANLNRLLGRDPATPIELVPAGMPAHIPASAGPGIEQALKQRPELLLLEEELKAAKAGAVLAASQDKPGISMRAVAQTQTPSAFVRSSYFAAGLVLNWTPFDGGKTRADVREARARAAQLEALLEDAKLGIRVDVEKAVADAQEALHSIEAADRQIAAAQAAADVSELRYQARSATQIEVSAAIFNVTKARSNRVQALGNLLTALAEYDHAVGAEVAPSAEARGTPAHRGEGALGAGK